MKSVLIAILICSFGLGINEEPKEVNNDDSIKTQENVDIPEYVEYALDQDSEYGLVFIDKENGYLVDLPESWNGKVVVRKYKSDNSYRVEHLTEAPERNPLFSIYRSNKEAYDEDQEEPTGVRYAVNSDKSIYIGYDRPLELQYSVNAEYYYEEYENLLSDIGDISQRIHFIDEK